MLTSKVTRGGAVWRWAWVWPAAATVLLAAGCASGIAGQAGTTTAGTTTAGSTTPADDWNPQHRQTVAADIDQGSATIHVGERLQFTPRDSDTVYFSVEPVDIRSITFYGNDLTFIGIRPGTATLTMPNYDKHFDCPNGPCAHPNAPLTMEVTVLAGPASAPMIPAPIVVSTAGQDRTLHLEVGQQLQVSSSLETFKYSSEDAGTTLDGELGDVGEVEGRDASSVTMVAARPGLQMIGLVRKPAGTSVTPTRLTIVIDP